MQMKGEKKMEEMKVAAKDEKDTKDTKVNMEVILQYRDYEVNMDAVTERVKSHYIAKGYKEPI